MASLHLTRNSDSVTVSVRDGWNGADEIVIPLRTVDHYRLVIDGVEIDVTEDDIEEYRR